MAILVPVGRPLTSVSQWSLAASSFQDDVDRSYISHVLRGVSAIQPTYIFGPCSHPHVIKPLIERISFAYLWVVHVVPTVIQTDLLINLVVM